MKTADIACKVEIPMRCPVCNGKGTTPMATMALYIPPAERRALDQTAADNPVTCWRCDGTGLKNEDPE